jgi:3-phosphoinositide dependent protein kinase-1
MAFIRENTHFYLFLSSHEYDIFQKVVKVSYTKPDGFDANAQDLISKLVVADPDQRLGANESCGYDKLKEHCFFEQIDWKDLIQQTPLE